MNIRNIAIIAHVDHGKSTLVDNLLKQSDTDLGKVGEQEHIMDSNELEQERGITIFSKNAAAVYNDTKINIIDTPGHADFGGEVERVLNMADGALLIVDAAEGPLSQTKFVLKKALEFGLKIILVINKIDRKDARVADVIRDTENLFLTVVNDDDLLDFPVIYAIGRDGKTFDKMPDSMEEKGDTTPLFEKILSYIPSARVKVDKPLQMQISAFDKNEYLGNLALGRISQGRVRKNDFVSLITPAQKLVGNYRIEKMYVNEGIKKVEAMEAESGEIVYLAGISDIKIGETITDPHYQVAISSIEISEPTIKASFGPNTSVFARDEAKFLTSRELKERLHEEVETNLGMKVEDDKTDSIRMIVAGRGELHLAILIEKLRREGYAMEVGKPEVIFKTVEGKTLEPFSEVTIIVPDNFVGVVTTEMGKRKAQMLDMVSDEKMGTKAT
ncbi:MAG TPA: GTP-binding protein, partial [Patescibacteria group bacterium]|nr:GTP-binding protein [Patescibacteria group bacterium]